MSWFFSGCPYCGYMEHTPRPRESCPNDGEKLIRLPGLVGADKLLSAAHRTVRTTIDAVREIASEAPLPR